MTSKSTTTPGSKEPVWRAAGAAIWRSFKGGGLGVALGFALVAAMLLNPLFATPFLSLLGRTIFIALLMLGAFYAVQRLPAERVPRWLPRWALALIAMTVVAPMAAFLGALLGTGGDLEAVVNSEPRMRGFLIVAAIALVLGMVIALSALLRRQEADARALALRFELERKELERQALDARLSLLQAQVQPHFLFNTLANVQALVESNSPRAADVLKSLIAYLRAAVPRMQGGPVPLAEELQLVRAYLELMQMRMPDRLQFSVTADPALQGQTVLPLALLTLVENAVRHGLDPQEEGGRIDVRATLAADGRALQIVVADTGVGLNPHAQPGTGLANLRARLAAQHGAAARLELSENTPRGVCAVLLLPLPH